MTAVDLLVDPLEGVVPTWRIDAEEAPPTVPIPLRPTTALPAPARAPRKRRQPSARRAAS